MSSTRRDAKGQRKYPKKCTLTIYHAGSVFLCIGIIVALIAIATSRLFEVYIYDHRKPARFLNVHIPVGLYSGDAEVTWLSSEHEALPNKLELTDSRWIIAQTLSVIGLLSAIACFIIHIALCRCNAHHKWSSVIWEVCGLLLAVTAILIGLSLAESEIEYIHDHGDEMLTNFLLVNNLLDKSEQEAWSGKNPPRLTNTDEVLDDNKGDFALFLSPPQLSFALLIASDFLILIAFLAVLIYFVRLCEKAVQARKQMQSAEISHA